MTAQDSQPDNSEPLPGALLRAAREKAGLSEEEVARELHITVKKVRALEADDYQQLHSDIFIRGYLRGYARLVNLEPEALLETYGQARRQAGLDLEEEESPLQINIPEPRRPLWHFGLAMGLLLLVVWAGSIWFLGNRPPTGNTGSEGENSFNSPALQAGDQGTDEAGSRGSDQKLAPGNQDNEAGGSELEESGSSIGNNSSMDAPRDNEATLGTTQQPEPQNELDLLRLEFSGECWVEVVDARGDVLETDLLLAGESIELRGEAPFDVKLGNARVVEMELNGRPFDFEPPATGRTLTLEVVDQNDNERAF